MCRKSLADYGEYVDPAGARWTVECCRRVRPTTGWTEFETMEECMEAWNLTYDPLME